MNSRKSVKSKRMGSFYLCNVQSETLHIPDCRLRERRSPSSMFDSIVLIEIAAFLLAGTVKGVLGLGLPTVSIGLLSLVMPPVQAAAILLVPSTVTNLWQLALGPGLRPLLH